MKLFGRLELTASKRKDDSPLLFPLGDPVRQEPLIRRLRYPIWTELKAKLIEEYLFLFVQITHHGTYIDAFTGPQESDKPHTWAAKLVLERAPRWFRNFFLFEVDRRKVQLIKEMVELQPPRDKKKKEPSRDIKIFNEDCNQGIRKLLDEKLIRQKEATFCLLDQHTFECHWATLEALARYKRDGENKIELFYFFPTGWFNRALKNTKDHERLRAWWGRDDWEDLQELHSDARVNLVAERFRKELGYASVKAWPIRSEHEGGRVMYHMVHATDHPDAPGLMRRAYDKVVIPPSGSEQMAFKV